MTNQRHHDDAHDSTGDATRGDTRAEYSQLDPDTITEDAIDTFERRGDADSRASDAAADAPG